MTTKTPVHKFSRDGNRLYLNPESRETVPSVTSITDALPKPFLQFWGQKIVAQCAIDNIEILPTLLEANGRQGLEDFLKKAPQRNTADAAQMGSTAHKMFDELSTKGETENPFDQDEEAEKFGIADQYIDQFINFLDVVDPEFLYTEETVWSETQGYAGSFDAIVKLSTAKLKELIEPEAFDLLGINARKKSIICMLDYKTSRSGVYPEVALQVNAYNGADFIVRGDAEKLKLPKCDIGLVLHIRPDFWKLHPVALHEDIFSMFLSLKHTKQWDKLKKGVLGKPIVESF